MADRENVFFDDPLALVQVSTHRRSNSIDGYRAADMRIDGVRHDTHRSATQLPDDAVPADAVRPVSVIARMRAARSPAVLSRVTGADFETLLDRQSCGWAKHIAGPQF
jgi:hypothetical protein